MLIYLTLALKGLRKIYGSRLLSQFSNRGIYKLRSIAFNMRQMENLSLFLKTTSDGQVLLSRDLLRFID